MACFMAVIFFVGNVKVMAAESPFEAITNSDSTVQIQLKNPPAFTNIFIRFTNAVLVEEKQITTEETEGMEGTTPGNKISYQINPGIYYFKDGIMTELTTDSAYPTYNFISNSNSLSASNANNAFVKGKYTISASTTVNVKSITSSIKAFSGLLSVNNKSYFYKGGALYTGVMLYNKVLYKATNGKASTSTRVNISKAGVLKGSYFDVAAKKAVPLPKTGWYIKNGVKVSGKKVVKVTEGKKTYYYYYANGVCKGLNDWVTIDSKIYYIGKDGKALTGGFHKLKSYGRGVKKYNYLFSKSGVLYTDLIKYYGYDKFIQKDIKIITNKTTHNTTFYLKDKKGNFTVPAKTVICATARKKNDTRNGTFRLEKTWNKRWFIYTKTYGAPYRYYQWAVHIKGTASLFHSSTYRTTSAASLRTEYYNQLGTSCTTHCIRLQAYYAKMIYDIATRTNPKRRVPVQIITSPNEGPFGHVSLTKVKSGTKWDPTDPNRPK